MIGPVWQRRSSARIVSAFAPAILALSASYVLLSGQAAYCQKLTARDLTPLQLEIERQRQRLSSLEAEERRDALMRLGGLHRSEASQVAVEGLKDGVPIVRATAVSAVLSLAAPECVAALSPLLSDKKEFVRQEAAYALGAVHSRAAVEPLIGALSRDGKNSVRGAAAVALGQIADEGAVIPLAQILSPESLPASAKKINRRSNVNQFVLRAAARSLGQIGSRAATPALISALMNEGLPDDVRREAAQALGLIADPAAAPALRSVLTARDPYLSRAAADALNRIAPEKGQQKFAKPGA